MVDNEEPNWDRIVDRHGERVFRIALRIVGSVHDAEDVSQEVFVEAYRLHRAGSVRSWNGLLVRLSTLRAIDWLRRRRPSEALSDDDRVSTLEPHEELAAKELAQWLRAAMAGLPERQAAVLAMAHFEKLSRDQIAANLGISPKAVSTALYKGRQRLLSQLSVFNRRDSQ